MLIKFFNDIKSELGKISWIDKSENIKSTAGVALRLEADTDNSGEFDVPFIKLLGDGGAVRSLIGQSPGTGKAPDGHDVTNAVSKLEDGKNVSRDEVDIIKALIARGKELGGGD